MKYILILIITLISLNNGLAQKLDPDKEYLVSCVGFYNVENLFDTINTNGTKDLEFSPKGDRRWNTKLYRAKLENLAHVIHGIGTEVNPDGLALLGVSEIENKSVLDDLVVEPKIKSRNYKVVHYDGHDHRGIDVALLYQEKYFKYIESKSFELVFEDTSYHSRDQLLVTGELVGERVHVPGRSLAITIWWTKEK